MNNQSPVLLIGLDATEIDVVDRLIAAGRLPTLAGLRARGRWGRLQTQPPNFLSLVWPTFLCSAPLGDHGWYFNKIWNPDRQRLQYVDPLASRAAVLDLARATVVSRHRSAVPCRRPRPANMTLLNAGSADDFGRLELPKGLRKQLTVRHGPCMTPEVFGPQTAATLLAQRQEVLSGNRQ
jgi:hypothetical protein